MASGKTVGGWLSGDLLKHAERRIADDFKGNQSGFISSLIQQDQSGRKASDAPDEKIIVALAERFQPTLKDSLAKQLALSHGAAPVRQARVVARFLDALSAALENDFDPEQPFHLVDQTAVIDAAVDRLAKKFGLAQFAGVNEEKSDPPIPNSPASEEIQADRARREELAKATAAAARRGQTRASPHRSKS